MDSESSRAFMFRGSRILSEEVYVTIIKSGAGGMGADVCVYGHV